MTRKQEAFVAEFLIDLNGAKAATRAGYSARTAGEQAYELLRNPEIAAAIERGMEQRLSRVDMKQDSVLYEMSLLANSRLDWFVIDDNGQVALSDSAPEGAMAAVQSIKRRSTTRTDKGGTAMTTVNVEIKLWDKVMMLRLMGRHVGLFPDRIEHACPGEPVEVVTRIERVIVADMPFGTLASDTKCERAIAAQERKLLEG